MTTEDGHFTFVDRTKDKSLDIRTAWGKLAGIEILSPTRGVMHFSSPDGTAAPRLAFLDQYVVPKNYLQSVGVASFNKAPVGSILAHDDNGHGRLSQGERMLPAGTFSG